MAFAPVRFLHAADLRLDQAIGEIPKLPPRLASIVQDATRAAFDRLVALAIEHEVDFVLLSGNTFAEADQSLSARLSLLDGFEQLDRSGILALVLPGPLDPLDAWRRIPDLPQNLKFLEPGPKGIVPVKRDDKVVARVGTELFMPARKKAKTLRDELRSATQRAVPFKIAAIHSESAADETLLGEWCPEGQSEIGASASDNLTSQTPGATGERSGGRQQVSVDYVALGGGEARRTLARRRGLAHDPGPLQGRGPHHSGPRGCTLVTVEQDGTLRSDFLPAASVRWERFTIDVPVPFDRGELLARCRRHLEGMRTEACENAWIFEWVVRGSRPAIDGLEDESFQRQIRQDLANMTVVPSADDAIHHLTIEAESDSDRAETVDPLHSDFLEALAACRRTTPELIHGGLSELQAADAQAADRLEGLLAELSNDAIGTNAERIGEQLFGTGAGAGR